MYEGSSIRWAPGLVNFVPGVAYHFCLNLHAAFSQPGARFILAPFILAEMRENFDVKLPLTQSIQ